MYSVADHLRESARTLSDLSQMTMEVEALGLALWDCLCRGGCIYWMGNGGSAADAQHLSTELMARFEIDREPIPSLALTTDTSLLTAWSNDYSFEGVFARQVSALAKAPDAVIGLSTSGRSRNVLMGLEEAKRIGCFTALLTGQQSEVNYRSIDVVLRVPSRRVAHIQEAHICVGQALCGYLEFRRAQGC